MLDFKLISADGHINEPPAAWERVQKEYGDRAPKVVKDPEEFKGIWVITDGLPPSPCSNYSIGHVVSKPDGLGSVDLDKHHQRIHFHEIFKYASKIKMPTGSRRKCYLPASADFSTVSATARFSAPFFALTTPGSMNFAATIQTGSSGLP